MLCMYVIDNELDALGDKVSEESLSKLGDSEKLKELLHNKHLRDYLQRLNTSRNPEGAMDRAMREPLFIEFADACLQIIEPANEPS